MPTEREAIRKILRERPDIHQMLLKALAAGKLKSTDDIPETDEEYIVLCGLDHGGVEGSKQGKCGCGAIVWMSPSTQELIKSRKGFPTRVVCVRCAVRGGLET